MGWSAPRTRCRSGDAVKGPPMKGFADVDVAQTRNDALIEQGRLQRRSAPASAFAST